VLTVIDVRLDRTLPTPEPSPLLIELAGGDTTPWFADQLAAVAFVILGGALTLLSTWLIERRKTSQEDRTRYMDRQLEHASVMAEKAKEVRKVVARVGWSPTAGATKEHRDAMQAARDEIKVASAEALEANSKISLIAPESLRQPARNLNGAILYARTVTDAAGAKHCETNLKDALGKFESACRKHFGAE
jgi:hypothetical protein